MGQASSTAQGVFDPADGGETGQLLTRLARLVPGVIYQYRLWPDGRSAFPYSSPGMVDIYEVTPDEVREDATPVFTRLHPDDAAKVGEDIYESARTLETFYADFRVILPRQGLRWRWSQAVPERLEDGSTLWHGIILDATDRKLAEQRAERLQAELAQAQKLESIGRLAGGIAHDFNNMLGVILGNADLALDALEPAEPARRQIDEIQTAARRSSELTRQLLAFARRQPAGPESLDVATEMPALLAMLRRLIGEDVRLVWDPEPDLWPARMDGTQFGHAMTNLALNARDAIAGVGTITIRAQNVTLDRDARDISPEALPGDYVRVEVADTGHGMTPDVAARVFEPFFTTKGVGEGTGLGLSSVHGNVAAIGGFVTMESAPGVGTTFYLWLPRQTGVLQEAKPARPQPFAARMARGTETLLLVEDEPALLRMLEGVLADRGYRLLLASTPAEALRLAAERTAEIDLLLTDVVMPEMNGRELAGRVAELHPEIRVLFMSGYLGDALETRLPASMQSHLIEKPFPIAGLLASVRAILDEG